ncbi:hypothetical protein RRG08_029321 [Elysia crispata]|uniref:Uncharacterized protein n=1 Tax=Elysia crispata TaxID=231223 RepID=A0AAE1ARV0_9GAST|nr:hypothetical protein RRG08_029321 [Elysia crispata]
MSRGIQDSATWDPPTLTVIASYFSILLQSQKSFCSSNRISQHARRCRLTPGARVPVYLPIDCGVPSGTSPNMNRRRQWSTVHSDRMSEARTFSKAEDENHNIGFEGVFSRRAAVPEVQCWGDHIETDQCTKQVIFAQAQKRSNRLPTPATAVYLRSTTNNRVRRPNLRGESMSRETSRSRL